MIIISNTGFKTFHRYVFRFIKKVIDAFGFPVY